MLKWGTFFFFFLNTKYFLKHTQDEGRRFFKETYTEIYQKENQGRFATIN